MIDAIKNLFWTSRPISWVNTAYPFAATYLVINGEVGSFWIIASMFFLIPYNLLMYGINDVFDYESDKNNPRKNSIEGGLTEPKFHKVIIYSSVLLCLPFAYYIFLHSNISGAWVFAVSIFFVLAYSAPEFRFKEIPILDSFTSAMHFVTPMIFAMALSGWQSSYILICLSFVCWAMASHAFGAVQDIIPDEKGGIKSIATYFGAKQTVRLSAFLYTVSALSLLPFLPASLSLCALPLLYIANIWPYIQVTKKDSPKTNKAWRRFIYLNFLSGAVITISLILIFG